MSGFEGISILNAAPAVSNLPESLYKTPTIFCVNEIEAQELTGIHFNEINDAKKFVETLLQRGCTTVIVTLGKLGAVLNYKGKILHIPVPKDTMTAVDSTGAGDMCIGGLAYFISHFPEATLMQQVAAAIKAATHSTQFRGTQSSYKSFPHIDPTMNEFVFHEL
jgi:ribokinase